MLTRVLRNQLRCMLPFTHEQTRHKILRIAHGDPEWIAQNQLLFHPRAIIQRSETFLGRASVREKSAKQARNSGTSMSVLHVAQSRGSGVETAVDVEARAGDNGAAGLASKILYHFRDRGFGNFSLFGRKYCVP